MNPSSTRAGRIQAALKRHQPECPWCKAAITRYIPERFERCDQCRKPIIIRLASGKAGGGILIKKPLLIIHHMNHGRTPCNYSDRHGVPGSWPVPEDPLRNPINIWSEHTADITCPSCRTFLARRKPTLGYGDSCEGPIFQQSHTQVSHAPVTEIPHAEIIVGPRYLLKDLRPGMSGTFVLEVDGGISKTRSGVENTTKIIPEPVSGPIVRCPIYENPTQASQGRPASWNAYCDRCLENSRPYKRKNEMALWKWAHLHRCKSTPPQPSGL